MAHTAEYKVLVDSAQNQGPNNALGEAGSSAEGFLLFPMISSSSGTAL